MSEPTREEAVRLVRERGFTITDPELQDCGRTVIHTRAGGIGADWDVEAAERYIEASKEVLWVDSLLGHNLGVVSPEGRLVCFDVARRA